MKFSCPHCGQRIAADDHLAGQPGQCPACGGAFRIPEGTDGAGEASERARPVPKSAFIRTWRPDPYRLGFASLLLVTLAMLLVLPSTLPRDGGPLVRDLRILVFGERVVALIERHWSAPGTRGWNDEGSPPPAPSIPVSPGAPGASPPGSPEMATTAGLADLTRPAGPLVDHGVSARPMRARRLETT